MFQLEIIQNKALLFITKTKWDHFSALTSPTNEPPTNKYHYSPTSKNNMAELPNQPIPHIYRQLYDNHPPIPVNNRISSSWRTAERPHFYRSTDDNLTWQLKWAGFLSDSSGDGDWCGKSPALEGGQPNSLRPGGVDVSAEHLSLLGLGKGIGCIK